MAEVSVRRTVAHFPHLLDQWHPEKNGDVHPNNVAAGSNKKFWWKCPVANDHEWQASPNYRVCMKSGCPCCAGFKVVPSNCLATIRPDLAAQWHSTKNGNLTSHDVVAGTARRVWWKCPVADDHEWESTISNRVYLNTGCPCCKGKKVVESTCLATTHPELAAQWHPRKNGDLTPHDVIAGTARKVWWLCPVAEDHVWEVAPSERFHKKTGCPMCRMSKGEKRIAEYLVRRGIPHKAQWGQRRAGLASGFAFDFAVNRNQQFWLIEYHGEHHYCPVNFGSRKERAKYRFFVNVVRRDGTEGGLVSRALQEPPRHSILGVRPDRGDPRRLLHWPRAEDRRASRGS